MKTMGKKLLSVLLALCLTAGLLPWGTVLAAGRTLDTYEGCFAVADAYEVGVSVARDRRNMPTLPEGTEYYTAKLTFCMFTNPGKIPAGGGMVMHIYPSETNDRAQPFPDRDSFAGRVKKVDDSIGGFTGSCAGNMPDRSDEGILSVRWSFAYIEGMSAALVDIDENGNRYYEYEAEIRCIEGKPGDRFPVEVTEFIDDDGTNSIAFTSGGTMELTGENKIGYIVIPGEPMADTAPEEVTTPDITGRVGEEIEPVTAVQLGGTPRGTFTADGLPEGLKINQYTGVIKGTPTETADGTYTVTYTNGVGTLTSEPASIRIEGVAAESVTAPAITGVMGTEIAPVTVTQTGGTEGGVFSAEGLPAGLSIDGASGVISGMVEEVFAGTYTATYTNDAGATVSEPASINIIDTDIAAESVAAADITGTAGTAIAPVTATQTGGTEGGVFTAEGLPRGLSIDGASGVISGTPAGMADTTYTVAYTTSGGKVTVSAPYTVKIAPDPSKKLGVYEGYFTVFDVEAERSDAAPTEEMRAAGLRYYNVTVKYRLTFDDVDAASKRFPFGGGAVLSLYPDTSGRTAYASVQEMVNNIESTDILGDVKTNAVGSMTDRTAEGIYSIRYGFGNDSYESSLPDENGNRYYEYSVTFKNIAAKAEDRFPVEVEIWKDPAGDSSVVYLDSVDGPITEYMMQTSANSGGEIIVPGAWTLTYNDGVDGEEVFADDVHTGLEVGDTLPAFTGTPEREGYAFKGWNTVVDGTGTAYVPGTDVMPDGDLVLYAQWNKVHTVSFAAGEGGSGEMEPLKIEDGESDTVPDNGFTIVGKKRFNGWNTAADGSGTAYAAGDPITPTEDMVLYAQWLDIYTIQFNANEGSGSIDDIEVVEGDSFVVPGGDGLTGPNGRRFKGWNTAADGSGTAYAADAPVTPTGDMVLYAQWYDLYTVSFHANGGGGTMEDMKIHEGESGIVPDSGFDDPSGMRFGGWNTEFDGSGTAYAAGDPITPSADTVLYAQWITVHTVSFDPNGGNGTMEPLKIDDGESDTVPNSGFEAPAGKSFKGWNTDPDGNGTAYAAGDPITPTGDMVLYAQWTDIYTVSFRANGGAGEMDDAEVPEGESFEAPDCGFTPPVGKKFKIWNDAVDGTGTDYAPGTSITPTENMVLYAQWEDETIEFVRDGSKLDAIKILRWDGMDHANSGEPTGNGYDPTMISDTVEVRNSAGEIMVYNDYNAATVRALLAGAVFERYTRNGLVSAVYAENASGVITVSTAEGVELLTIEVEENAEGKLSLRFTSKSSAAVRMELSNGYQFMVVTPGDADLNGTFDSNDWGLIMRWTLEAMANHDRVDFVVNDYDLWMLMADMDSLALTGERRDNVDSNDWRNAMYLALEGWKR
ncbi:MAG: InlB B-repeat-containing protein [Clostridia bacterium]|nr:InlB B-repeat-containing protein [Clostridia bacterium]